MPLGTRAYAAKCTECVNLRSCRLEQSERNRRGKAVHMTETEYVEQRLDGQIDWYSQKSAWNQSWYKWLRLTEIVCASLIPFLSGMGQQIPGGAWIIGTLGALIAVSAASGALFKFHENWIQYRTTSEQLKHERFLFLTGTKPYDDQDRFTVLVQRVENLISKENSSWAQAVKQAPKELPKA